MSIIDCPDNCSTVSIRYLDLYKLILMFLGVCQQLVVFFMWANLKLYLPADITYQSVLMIVKRQNLPPPKKKRKKQNKSKKQTKKSNKKKTKDRNHNKNELKQKYKLAASSLLP